MTVLVAGHQVRGWGGERRPAEPRVLSRTAALEGVR